MQISLKELRQLVKKTLSETYYGSSTQGSLASTAFNDVGPNNDIGVEIPIDPNDLAEQVRALIGRDAGYPLGDWGDEALNSAASAAADALINDRQNERESHSVGLRAEQRDLIRKHVNEARNILQEEVSDMQIEKVSNALNTIIELLGSMDMSLDLVYGSLSGHQGPIASISSLQKRYGRAMSAMPSTHGRGEE